MMGYSSPKNKGVYIPSSHPPPPFAPGYAPPPSNSPNAPPEFPRFEESHIDQGGSSNFNELPRTSHTSYPFAHPQPPIAPLPPQPPTPPPPPYSYAVPVHTGEQSERYYETAPLISSPSGQIYVVTPAGKLHRQKKERRGISRVCRFIWLVILFTLFFKFLVVLFNAAFPGGYLQCTIANTPASRIIEIDEKYELSGRVLVETRGAQSKGSVLIRQKPSKQASLSFTLHSTETILDRVSIEVQPDPSSGNVKVTANLPERLMWGECLIVDIDIGLPRQSPNAVKELSVSVSNSNVDIKNLQGIELEKLSLKTSNGGIFSDGFISAHATLLTSNADIRGLLSATESLRAETRNGPIKLEYLSSSNPPNNITLITSNASIQGKYIARESLSAHTSNGKIEIEGEASTITLLTSNGQITGDYKMQHFDATTTNGLLDPKLGLLNNNPVHIKATTRNAAAAVYVSDEFEGSFHVKTSNSAVRIIPLWNSHAKIQYKHLKRSEVAGTKSNQASKEGNSTSTIEITTTNGHANLEFI
ncbi:uncharacterized protein VTP21DRAFT_5071 [Calcarisporiella thermophila]|uniref:uncharacterized protein n=1 Tax=Calcarisporiella thermophila TaxID=911321 RepID=UPI003742ED05